MINEKEDGFDKVEKAVKKTTKIAVLIIGSIVTIVLTVYLAWGQITGEIQKEKPEKQKKTDTFYIKEKVDTFIIEKPVEKEIKKDRFVIAPKEEKVVDNADKVIDKVERLKKMGPILKKD